jgi:hypothetical protein
MKFIQLYLSERHTAHNRQKILSKFNIQKVKTDLNKIENEFLTIDEFCLYTGIKYEQVAHLIFG